MVIQAAAQSALVKVLQVRAQNRNGAIFRGQRITDEGEIVDSHSEITVRLQGRGVAARVMPGQWWRLTGKVASRTFINSGGFEMTEDQMEVEPGQAALRLPSGAHIVDYLARNPRFNGIGRVTAERLWETFKESLFEMLDDGDYQALVDVISPEKASVLILGWKEEGLSTTLQWLHSHGIGLAVGRRILSYFGADAADQINDNPYRLLSFAAGWAEVDKLAREHLGVARDDERRLAAAVEEVVYRRFSLGDTYVPRAELVAGLQHILKGEDHFAKLIDAAIDICEVKGRLLFDRDGNAYSLGASILENAVVDCIQRRLDRISPACDVNGIIRAYEEMEGHGFSLNMEQREAVHLVADNHFAVVTGSAGCGKTTVLKVICEVLVAQGYEIVQLALAGKAVKRMMESTGRPALTLASFIKKMRQAEDRGDAGAARSVALVIDEASMVDLISFSSAVRLTSEDAKVVLIGDPHQLPPVGPGLILHCLTEISEIPHVELKVAKRFGNEIAKIANSVKDGTFPVLEQFNRQVSFVEADEADMGDLAANLYLERPQDTVVLCATRRVAGTINQLVQVSLTTSRMPLRLRNIEFDQWEQTGFFEGDLLICTQNHWDLGIQNGSMGRLVSVAESTASSAGPAEIGSVEWDDGVIRPLHEDLLDSLELGYALTVHKSQGSQWRRVVVCLPTNGASRIIERSLVYTAITRAQDEIIILGRHALLTEAVGRKKGADRRRVGLPKRLAFARSTGRLVQ